MFSDFLRIAGLLFSIEMLGEISGIGRIHDGERGSFRRLPLNTSTEFGRVGPAVSSIYRLDRVYSVAGFTMRARQKLLPAGLSARSKNIHR